MMYGDANSMQQGMISQVLDLTKRSFPKEKFSKALKLVIIWRNYQMDLVYALSFFAMGINCFGVFTRTTSRSVWFYAPLY